LTDKRDITKIRGLLQDSRYNMRDPCERREGDLSLRTHLGAGGNVRRAHVAGRWAAATVAFLTLTALALTATRPATAGATHSQSKVSEAAGPPNMSYGSSSAPITMEVFSDYQCPSCRALYEQTLRPLINDYVASGKVYLVHRDFPLPMHKYGYEAARWANAAARVGEFANVEAALYDNQPQWSTDGDIEKYVAGAMPASDFKRVQKMMESCEAPPESTSLRAPHLMDVAVETHVCPLDKYINEDRAMGMKIPVQATPTYVITYKGQRLPAGSGIVSWPILKQFFDSLLSQ
jgi:hypothetical protein